MDLGERYLVLALRLARLAPDLVDSYSGAPALAESVAAEPSPTPAQLRDEARALAADVGACDDAARRRWLRAQLAGVETACATFAGERVSYRELVRRCHGVAPTEVPDDAFAAAHARLGDALPGAGDVRERYRAWLASQEVSPGAVPEAIATLADELQARTRTAFGLPAGERVDFELVSGERWGAFADYRGDLRTRVAINTDLPLYAFRLLEFVAHEAYPGHHTEHVCKEVALVRARGYAEAGVFLYPTPQALVAEGIAQVALRCLLGDDAEYVAAERLRPLGIAYEPETAAAVRAAREALGPVRTNVALLLDEGRASVDEARAYARRWMLEPDAHVDRAVRLLLARSWAPYESCYPEGLRLVRAFVDRERDGFRRLLTEQLTTSDLIG